MNTAVLLTVLYFKDLAINTENSVCVFVTLAKTAVSQVCAHATASLA